MSGEEAREAAYEAARVLCDTWRDSDLGCWLTRDRTLLMGATDGTVARLTEPQLRAVLAENARMREKLAKLDDAEFQWRIVAPDGRTLAPSAFDLANRDQWLPGVRLERRTVYGTPWMDADLHDGGNANA